MSSYAKRLAIDESMNPLQNAASPFPAKVSWNISNAVASSVISLNPNTTKLEISAFGGQGVAIRWIPLTEQASVGAVFNGSVIASGIGLANFDNFIPAGVLRTFVVPKETAGTPINPNVQIGSIQGLYQRLAWVNAGITASSILAVEI